ncbi:MAG TPA: RidA family protein [Pyrinomonadaceae bacterium]|jgi:2-iminobutanoate/2-iminopropanoate deaminase|nr:RidA family protein [Pyrinomonadaceae bacterium]
MPIEYVLTDNAPYPGGHYSQAVVCNGLVFVSGQLSIDPKTGEKKFGSIEEQTEQVLTNIAAILKAANSDVSRLLKVTIYVADNDLWAPVNAVYAKFLGDVRPARAVVPTGPLHYGFLVEIDAVAAVNESD